MLSVSDILLGVLLPLVLSGCILACARFLKFNGQWVAVLAIGAAFTAAFGSLEGFGHIFPPTSAIPRLFYLGPLFAIAGSIDATVRLPTWLRPLVVLIATVTGAGVLLRFQFTNHNWDTTQGVLWLLAIASVAALWWACFEYTAVEGGAVMPLGAMFITGIAGLVVMLVADQTVGQALGALGVALGAAAGVVGWCKGISLARGTATVVAGLGVCALAAAYFVSGVPIVDLTLIAIAPLLLASSRWLPLGRSRPWLHTSIRLFIVLIPLGIALVLAIAQFQREAAEKSSDPYSFGPSPRGSDYATPAMCSA